MTMSDRLRFQDCTAGVLQGNRGRVQLAQAGGSNAARQANKVQLEFCIPGMVEDDDSPKLELATPADEKTAPAKARN